MKKPAEALQRRPVAARLVAPLAIIVFIPLLWARLAHLDWSATGAALGALGPGQWFAALALTGVSFVALGQYDALLHRVLGTGVPGPRARIAGMQAIAIAQVLGLGAVTGALVRWRALPQLSLATATRLTVLVSLSFMTALAVLALLALALAGPWPLPVLLGAAALLAALGVRTRTRRSGIGVSGALVAGLIAAAAVDTAAAGAALWVLMPDDAPLVPVLAAYLLALGAGLLSNAPGGVGAFDLTLIALLPALPEPQLVAALVAFRAIYYALPAVIAAASLLRAPNAPILAPVPLPADPPHPDWGLARQDAQVLGCARERWLTASLPGLLAALGPQQAGADPARLAAQARAGAQRVALYKADPRLALRARRAGWAVLRVAREGWIALDAWTTDIPDRRTLRRKLRAAAKAGVAVRPARAGDGPVLARIAAGWAAAHGGERGLSMGRFDPAYLAGQHVLIAEHRGAPIAFASFHTGADWGLDLMRHAHGLPDGTMHALVAAGIAAAQATGAARLSLAAVPAIPAPWDRLPGARPGGLAQFKRSFAPAWHPLYLAAPSWAGLALAAAQLARGVRRPGSQPAMTPVEQDHARISFDPAVPPCDMAPIPTFAEAGHDPHHAPSPS